MKHAPLPYRQLDEIILSTQDGRTDHVANVAHRIDSDRQNTAAFIVRACNAHDDLVSALDMLQKACLGASLPRNMMIHLTEARTAARAALAKAKGEA